MPRCARRHGPALHCGAFGFTTSRTDSHKTPDGEVVPSRDAEVHELLGIGWAMGLTQTGAFGVNSDFDDEDFELHWMPRLAQDTGRPVWFLLTDRYSDPRRWRRLMAAVHKARSEGLPSIAQIAGRPVGVMLGIGTALNPFTIRPSYQAAQSRPIEDQRRMQRDPAIPRPVLAERAPGAELAKPAQFRQVVTTASDHVPRMGDPPDYEPGPEKSVAAIAEREGHTPEEVAYDYLLGDGQYLYFPVVHYVTGDHGPIRSMLNDPAFLLGLSDGGAHCSSIVDAGVPTCMLTHWARDRSRGPKLPLELLVKRQTSETANFFGFADRGGLAPGLRADVNLIDFSGRLQTRTSPSWCTTCLLTAVASCCPCRGL